jgi:hypothetical protein
MPSAGCVGAAFFSNEAALPGFVTWDAVNN